MIYHNVSQPNTVTGEGIEWHQLRIGKPTASEFRRIITPKMQWPTKASETYINDLIGQEKSRCLPYNAEYYKKKSRALEHGTETEPEARNSLAFEIGLELLNGGFCETDDHRFGCSPDAIISDWQGGVEIKCPQHQNHIKYVREGIVPPAYMPQIHGCLAVTGFKYWIFESYHDGIDPLIIKVTPNKFTDELRAALEEFWVRYAKARKQFGLPIIAS